MPKKKLNKYTLENPEQFCVAMGCSDTDEKCPGNLDCNIIKKFMRFCEDNAEKTTE